MKLFTFDTLSNTIVDSLMRRPKWNTSTKNPIVGDLVLIKRPNDPHCLWR